MLENALRTPRGLSRGDVEDQVAAAGPTEGSFSACAMAKLFSHHDRRERRFRVSTGGWQVSFPRHSRAPGFVALRLQFLGRRKELLEETRGFYTLLVEMCLES